MKQKYNSHDNLSSNKSNYFDTDHLRNNLKTRALKGATASIFGKVLSFLIQTISTIILARLLSPNDFGLVTMVVIVSLFLSNISSNAFIEAIVQSRDINQHQISALFTINVMISVVLSVVLIVFSSVIVSFYKEPRLKYIIFVFAVINIITGLSVQHIALLRRNMQFYEISITEITATLFSAIISIMLALLGWGYWALVAKWMVISIVTTVGVWMYCGWRPGIPDMRAGIRPLVNYGIFTCGVSTISYFKKNIDNVIIGKYFGSQMLGFYDRSFHLASLLPNQVIFPLYSVAVSTFSRLSDDKEKYKKYFLDVLSIIAFIGMPMSAILTINSRDIIYVLLGPQWIQAADIFFALGLSIGIIMIYLTHGWLHLSLGMPKRWFQWSIFETILITSFIVISIPYGTVGVAFALSLSYCVILFPSLWYAGKPINIGIMDILLSVWKFIVSALIAGITCRLALKYYYTLQNNEKIIYIIFKILIISVLYLLLYLLIIIILHGGIKPIKIFVNILGDIKRSLRFNN
jgi:PST family polysaccharide transporter